MKIFGPLLALTSVIMVMILPSTSGLKCVSCKGTGSQSSRHGVTEEEKATLDLPCSGYKKGDSKYNVDCDHITQSLPDMHRYTHWICMAAAKKGSACVSQSKTGGKPGKCSKVRDEKTGKEEVACFCDTDLCNADFCNNLCNRSSKMGGGSWVGIVVISLGLFLIQQVGPFGQDY